MQAWLFEFLFNERHLNSSREKYALSVSALSASAMLHTAKNAINLLQTINFANLSTNRGGGGEGIGNPEQ